jgi:uncharacterized coiled-coil protein SlyX
VGETTVTHVPGEAVHTVEGAGNELIDPVIQHTERITNLESGMSAQEERLNNRIIELESQLREAINAKAGEERIASLEEKIVALQSKLEDTATHPVETAEAVPGAAVTLVTPVVEDSPAPPEQERRSIRHRRKNRRTKK